jgi:hypothetical protein
MKKKFNLESEVKLDVKNEANVAKVLNLANFRKILSEILASIDENLTIKKIEAKQIKKEELYLDSKDSILQKKFVSVRVDLISNKLTIKIRLYKDNKTRLRESLEYTKQLSSLELLSIIQSPSKVLEIVDKNMHRILQDILGSRELTIVSKITTNPRKLFRIYIGKKGVYGTVLIFELIFDKKIFENLQTNKKKIFRTLELEYIAGDKRFFNELAKRLSRRLQLQL